MASQAVIDEDVARPVWRAASAHFPEGFGSSGGAAA
jgi:hypothetical protein